MPTSHPARPADLFDEAHGRRPDAHTESRLAHGELSAIPWSATHPPPIELLRTKLFAVHTRSNPLTGNELPTGISGRTFRPTLHFALGEQVRAHYNGSWDDKPFAVVTPLGNLESQLLNVAPHDTFILGPLKLSPATTVISPAGTDVSALPKDVPVVFYEPAKGLRAAIDEVIGAQDGWHVQMRPGDVDYGFPAMLGAHDINAPGFFKAMLEEHPQVSFGTHASSVGGEGHRFGWVDSVVRGVPAVFSNSHPIDLRLYSALGRHHLEVLDAWMGGQPVSQEVRADYADKRTAALAHFDALEKLATDREASRTPTGPAMLTYSGWMLNSVPPDEFETFVGKHAALFLGAGVDQGADFRVAYAVSRWITVGAVQAKAEGLDRLLAEWLPQTKNPAAVLAHVQVYLDRANSRLPEALALLALPAVRAHLNRTGFVLSEGQPRSLDEVIAAHPEGRGWHHGALQGVPNHQQVVGRLLIQSGLATAIPDVAAIPNLVQGVAYGRQLREAIQQIPADVTQVVTVPLNRAQRQAPVFGRLLTDIPPQMFFAKLGLGEAYRRRFSNDEAFWSSPLTLWAVYEQLRADVTQPNS